MKQKKFIKKHLITIIGIFYIACGIFVIFFAASHFDDNQPLIVKLVIVLVPVAVNILLIVFFLQCKKICKRIN